MAATVTAISTMVLFFFIPETNHGDPAGRRSRRRRSSHENVSRIRTKREEREKKGPLAGRGSCTRIDAYQRVGKTAVISRIARLPAPSNRPEKQYLPRRRFPGVLARDSCTPTCYIL